MIISGLQKTTLLDYPGHIAATVFLGGCNFRCPFCHNSDLLRGDLENPFTEESVLSFLKTRISVLEGICITGGEPTLHEGLTDFMRKVRELGLLVKLDTNGYRPDILKSLCEMGLLNYVAMDIKSGKTGYAKTAGLSQFNLSLVEESVDFLLRGSIPYEFRTTVVKELHSAEDFGEIGPWLSGCTHYYLQSYRDSEQVLTKGFSACTKEELLSFADTVSPYVGNVTLRGIDY